MTDDNVIPMKKRKPDKGAKFTDKWGPLVAKMGHLQTPSLLLKAQDRLGLSPTQLNVLLQVMDHWWNAAANPYPSKQLIANKMGMTPRQVQRVIAELETGGFIRRIERYWPNGGKNSNEYDFTGLVKKLQKLAPEFIAIEEETRSKRRAVVRRGHNARVGGTAK